MKKGWDIGSNCIRQMISFNSDTNKIKLGLLALESDSDSLRKFSRIRRIDACRSNLARLFPIPCIGNSTSKYDRYNALIQYFLFVGLCVIRNKQ